MAEKKPWVSVGVFGLPAKLIKGVIYIKVNERTDQRRQWELAKMEPIPGVSIVDCPGGTMKIQDFEELKAEGLLATLKREIGEETCGCEITVTGDFSRPYFVATNKDDPEKPFGDIAVWAPIILIGEPKPSNEAKSHPWICIAEFEMEKPYRCVSGFGNKGRTGQMIRSAFNFYELMHASGHHMEFFSQSPPQQ